MSDQIEILGQKLAYPNTWQGASAVFFFCLSLTLISWFAFKWLTPEAVQALNAIVVGQNAEKQQLVLANQKLLQQVEYLQKQVDEFTKGSQTVDVIDKKAITESLKQFRKEREEILSNVLTQQKAQQEILNSAGAKLPDEKPIVILQQQQQQQQQQTQSQLNQLQQQIQQMDF